jgi:RNA 2',3'-cyclic 3'-phosphodiesterase
MRAFVAVDLPPLEPPIPPGLRPEDHVTLHFFDELPVERVALTVEAMAEAATASGPFEIEVRGVGAFPTTERPRVVWAGVGHGSSSLQSLADQLRRALVARGFPVEPRPFVPHLTLSRVRSARDAAWARQFLAEPENTVRVWVRTRVTEILLKESELLPHGARHTVRERVPLRAAPGPPPGPV